MDGLLVLSLDVFFVCRGFSPENCLMGFDWFFKLALSVNGGLFQFVVLFYTNDRVRLL